MRELRWVHRGWFARRWDLVEGERVLATLTQRGWGFNADLDHAGERSKLDVTGFLRWSLNVRDERGFPVASMRLGWRGNGEPTLANGRRFQWEPENWLGTRWTLVENERGTTLATAHMDAIFRMNARLQVHTDEPDATLVPLLALTWLAVVLTTQAASSAGGAG